VDGVNLHYTLPRLRPTPARRKGTGGRRRPSPPRRLVSC